MGKGLDVEKIRSALKSAAKNAVSGPRELRAGRLISRDAGSGRFIEKEPHGAAKDRGDMQERPKR